MQSRFLLIKTLRYVFVVVFSIQIFTVHTKRSFANLFRFLSAMNSFSTRKHHIKFHPWWRIESSFYFFSYRLFWWPCAICRFIKCYSFNDTSTFLFRSICERAIKKQTRKLETVHCVIYCSISTWMRAKEENRMLWNRG